MFSYVDASIKKRLIERGQLVTIDEYGRVCPPESRDPAPFISVVGPIPLPVRIGEGQATFTWYAWVRNSDLHTIEEVVEQVRAKGPKELYSLLSSQMSVNSALTFRSFQHAEAPLVRVHSNCLTGDVLGSLRCDCQAQLHAALAQIVHQGVGALVYMAGHEGRGIGLWAKAITYLLQDAGHDTYSANQKLGLPSDSRDFSDAGRILRFLRGTNTRIRLLGNNPLKREALEAAGLSVETQEPLVVGVNAFNRRYLNSKLEHGHLIPIKALGGTEPDTDG